MPQYLLSENKRIFAIVTAETIFFQSFMNKNVIRYNAKVFFRMIQLLYKRYHTKLIKIVFHKNQTSLKG